VAWSSKLAPNHNESWTDSVLHSFCTVAKARDGSIPYAGLIFDQAGNLCGTTSFNGLLQSGTKRQPRDGSRRLVFELTPNAD
jgi:hypothetical protein